MVVVILVVLQISHLEALQCYHCDTAANVSCPGWERPPIDSVKTKLDVVGLFNHCVTVKLADGRIIEQNIYPGSTHSQGNQYVTVDCCTEELCNGPKDKTLAWSHASYLSSPLTLLLITLAI